VKFFKILFKLISGILLLLLIAISFIFLVENYNSNYLEIDDHNSTDDLIISNVNVIPMSADTIYKNQTVIIKDGIINSIQSKTQLQEGIEVIDGFNKFLAPGLIDMHVHVWDEYELGLYLANGVTAVRNVWGLPMHLRLKESINAEEIYSPNFYTSGPKLTGPEFIGDDNLNLTNPKEAANKIIDYKKRGYDFIKTYYGLTPEIYDAIIDQAKSSKLDIIAHPSQKVPYSYHFNNQIKSIEHAEDIVQQPLNYSLDTLKLKEVVSDFADYGKANFCPTLVVYYNIYQMLIDDNILQEDRMNYMNPLIKMVDSEAQFNRWQNSKSNDSSVVSNIKAQHDFHLKIVKDLHDAGVNIICGTDAGIGVTMPGKSIHKELQFYSEAGLSNFEVLKTATINAANTHELMSNMGTIEKAKIANLILLNDNPLEDLSTLQNPAAVIINGHYLSQEFLEVLKQEALERNNLLYTALFYLENLLVEK